MDRTERLETESLEPSSLICAFCALALTCDVVLGPYALRWMGVHYASTGGNPITKIHPGTYLTFLATGIYLLADGHVLRRVAGLARHCPLLCQYCIGMLVVTLYVLSTDELGDVPTMLDTYLAPGLLALMLVNATPRFLRHLVGWMVALLVVNAIAGIFEARLHARLFPFITDDRELHEDYFRATAFVGHPLRNAMMTAMAAVAVIASGWALWLRCGLLGILSLGLLAFGGRTALLIGLAGCLMVAAWDMHRRVRADAGAFVGSALLSATLLIGGSVGLGSLFGLTKFGERIVAEDVAGSSSASRWELFDIFHMTNLNDLIGGYPAKTIEAMAGVINLTGIEDFWVYMLLFLGFAGYLIWLPAFLAGQVAIWRCTGFPGRVLLICFLAMASSNNGIAKKGVIMSVAFAFVIGAGCVDNRLNTQRSMAPA